MVVVHALLGSISLVARHVPFIQQPAGVFSRITASATGMEEEDAAAALVRWIEERGGHVSDSIAIERREGLRGIFTTADVSAGDLLMTIPMDCTISATENPEFGLTLAQLCACRLGGAMARNEFSEYIDSLPPSEPVLCDWSDDELSQLCSPALVAEAAAQRDYVQTSIEQMRPWVSGELSDRDIAWAERMVRTRALSFEYGWKGQRTMCLVPLIDLANHRTPQASQIEPVQIDLEAEAVRLVAPTHLSKGSEIQICYRLEGNGALLLDYGFAETPQAGDRVSYEQLRLGSPAAAAEAAGLIVDAAEAAAASGGELIIGSDDDDEYAVRILRLWLKQALRGGAPDEAEQEVSAANIDRAVCEVLSAACTTEFRRLTVAERALTGVHGADAGTNSRARSAVGFRGGQFGQLERTMDALYDVLQGDDIDASAIVEALRSAREFAS